LIIINQHNLKIPNKLLDLHEAKSIPSSSTSTTVTVAKYNTMFRTTFAFGVSLFLVTLCYCFGLRIFKDI
jgi:hypothetical protein